MRILFNRNITGQDYLTDGLMHGMRQLANVEFYDDPRIFYMYKSEFDLGGRDIRSLYGNGFTLYGSLPDDGLDRADLDQKIRLDYFDLYVLDVCVPGTYFQRIIDTINPAKIALVNGADEEGVYTPLSDRFRYFKREWTGGTFNVMPISFGFPQEKIQKPIEKTRSVAHIDPRDRSTYIYNDEQEYYNGYNESLFGVTKKKGGWDCMRHYEIIGSQCVPWFIDIDNCPEHTCTTLPKSDLKKINQLINVHGVDAFMSGTLQEQYQEINDRIQKHFLKYCTTEAIAKYVIDNTLMRN